MDLLGGAGPVDVADALAGDGVEDLHRRAAGGAQADAVARPPGAVPHGDGLVAPPAVADEELVVEGQPPHALLERRAPPALVGVGEGQLVGGAAQVRIDHVRVARVHDGGLRRAAEQLLGVGREPLVELVVAGHEDGGRGPAAPTAGPAHLLPERRDRAGEPVEDHRVEPADVDAELEGGGGHHRGQLAGEQLVLDGPPLLGEVAAPVGAHPGGQAAGQAAAHLRGDGLRGPAAPGERERGVPRVDQPRGDRRRLAVGRRPGPRAAVEQGRLPQRDRARRARGAVVESPAPPRRR